MNRRRFIATLLAFAVAPKIKPPMVPQINPAWVTAPYECEILYCATAMTPLLCSPYSGIRFGVDPNPLRISYEQGQYVEAKA